MSNVLAINTSLSGNQGQSNQLVENFVRHVSLDGNAKVTRRDLTTDELPHLSQEEMAAWMTPAEQRNEKQVVLASLSDNYIEEIQAADTIVIGMPMYNFGAPSVFKAWIDRIARAGVTFRYTETGPVGLLNNKKVIILATRGGVYQGTPKDTQTQYIRDVFSFVGIDDVSFVYAEGLAMGEENAESAKKAANKKIVELIQKTAA